jgi:hypothetical protein
MIRLLIGARLRKKKSKKEMEKKKETATRRWSFSEVRLS